MDGENQQQRELQKRKNCIISHFGFVVFESNLIVSIYLLFICMFFSNQFCRHKNKFIRDAREKCLYASWSSYFGID